MSDVPVTYTGGAADALAAAQALVAIEHLIIDKLRVVAEGLEQDLTQPRPGVDLHTPGAGKAELAAALVACHERIANEEALLAKLRQMEQGLIADLGWQRASDGGGVDGYNCGAL